LRGTLAASPATGNCRRFSKPDERGPQARSGLREDVFRRFFRLDDARNQDEGGTGLGLAIARGIARSHGGDITLGDSRAGSLRATVRVPV
jgi:two-component system osmolarity sensor histidine kinase EnvZ